MFSHMGAVNLDEISDMANEEHQFMALRSPQFPCHISHFLFKVFTLGTTPMEATTNFTQPTAYI